MDKELFDELVFTLKWIEFTNPTFRIDNKRRCPFCGMSEDDGHNRTCRVAMILNKVRNND